MTSATKNMTVLIVDPFEAFRAMISKVLQEFGEVTVIQSSHGNDALDKLAYHDVDLIIAEWQLSGLSGIEFLTQVRTNTRTANIPFLMTSSTIEQSHVVRAIQCGVSEFVVKPFSSKQLKSRIQSAFSRPIRAYQGEVEQDPEKSKDSQIQVLIVDDVADNIKVISDILRKDYKVRAALNGKKALQMCTIEPQPDIILLDIMMPEMDGLQVCEKLKSDPNTQHITVIFLTALEQTEHVVKGLSLGAVDYITKPANPAIVKSRVQAHCRNIHSNRLMRDQIDTMLENARLRDEFDNINQNELSKPIAHIKQAGDLLANHLRHPEQAKYYLNEIKLNCNQLQLQLESMSAICKIEKDNYALNPQPHTLSYVIDDVLENLANMLKQYKLSAHTSVDKNLQFFGERTLTYTLLIHLVKNAIEASSKRASININANQSDEHIVITIHNSDTVPQQVQAQFFEKFVSHGKPSHLGLGTYTARLLCEAQGGRLAFRTDQSLGTEVFVHLPKGK
ncbi:response regulator [Pseudoalteromonas sp. JBTF-M23]|uniref:Response regulator n=1 Tax=Pseudoalteromonas caenipelagi TaxID=2726988 RepID=A0A849VC53_9GAMM|nr:response regulator [Pseudoalteromonas caenipelagi]NOU51239.1 response regulator [Pseudoalteromonas caenipelagi]